MKLSEFKKRIADIQYQLDHGCGDNSCRYHRPQGMATNSSCRCHPDRFKGDLWMLLEDLEPTNKYRWDAEEEK